MSGTERYCRRVIFAGRVQGVGFRYTTQGIARGFAVAGFVRNLPDGTVELVAQGAAETVNDFVRAIHARLADNIDTEATTSEAIAASEQYSRFEIRR